MHTFLDQELPRAFHGAKYSHNQIKLVLGTYVVTARSSTTSYYKTIYVYFLKMEVFRTHRTHSVYLTTWMLEGPLAPTWGPRDTWYEENFLP